MSGFIKKQTLLSQDSFNSISTGIPTLDTIIQLQEGSLTCIYENENSFIHNTILQIFISQSLLLKMPVHAISMDPKTLKHFETASSNLKENENIKNLLIAWRYQSLGTKHILSMFNLREKKSLGEDTIVKTLDDLMEALATKSKCNFAIFSLFSPLFENFTDSAHIHNVLFEIRKYCKLNKHCIFLSIPRFFINQHTSQYFDNVFSVDPIFTLPHESANYNSILTILKLNSIARLRVNTLNSLKYGLILRSRKIIVEKIDIPPDESVGSCNNAF